MKVRYGRNVLITGASSGIGRACAELFARNGYYVRAASRRTDEKQELFGEGKIVGIRMDVCDEDSIKAAYDKLESENELPDIIIHCAGMGIGGAAEDTDNAAAHAQMETNYFGVLNVDRRFMPHMREQGTGLVIITSSVAALIAVPFQSHYSSSKAALETYCECLRMESRKYGIRACCIEPGDTKTSFTSARKMTIPEGSAYKADCERSVAKMAKDEQNGKSPDTVAKVALKMAKKKNPPVRSVVGFDYKLLAVLRKLLPKGLCEKIVAKLYT